MDNLVVQVPVTEKSKFMLYIALMSHFTGTLEEDKYTSDELTKREIEILSLLVYYNNIYASLPDNARAKYLHSNEIRKEIKEELSIDTNNFNNVLGRLSNKVLVFNKLPLYEKGKINPGLLDISKFKGVAVEFKDKLS